MTFKVIADGEAKREWNEAVDWYEEREAVVDWQFDDEKLLKTLLPPTFGRRIKLQCLSPLPPSVSRPCVAW